jgi:hypothetical protein
MVRLDNLLQSYLFHTDINRHYQNCDIDCSTKIENIYITGIAISL